MHVFHFARIVIVIDMSISSIRISIEILTSCRLLLRSVIIASLMDICLKRKADMDYWCAKRSTMGRYVDIKHRDQL
jgi:hypothetical protein